MEYGMIVLLTIAMILLYIKLHELQKVLKSQQAKMNSLCEATGNKNLSSDFISEKDMEHLIDLKKQGKEVEAIKWVRKLTSMDLLQAKQYMEKLSC